MKVFNSIYIKRNRANTNLIMEHGLHIVSFNPGRLLKIDIAFPASSPKGFHTAVFTSGDNPKKVLSTKEFKAALLMPSYESLQAYLNTVIK